MTIIKNSTLLSESIAALAADHQRTVQAVHDLIRDILDTRGAWLHAATADITNGERRLNYNVVVQLDGFLLDALVLLPDHKPEYQFWLTNPISGQTLFLKEIAGDQAIYVGYDKWVEAFGVEAEVNRSVTISNPIPRRSRYEAELSTARQVLEVIRDIEAVGKSAVVFGDGKLDLEELEEAEPLTV